MCDCRSDTDTTKSHQSTEAEDYRHSQATSGGQRERAFTQLTWGGKGVTVKRETRKYLYKGAGMDVCNREM